MSLAQIAAGSAAPVHAVIGADARAAVEDLGTDGRIALCDSPRHAAVLLVAGALRDADRPALRRLHDQLPHPRATVWWRSPPDPAFGPALEAAPEADPRQRLVEAHRALMTGTHVSEGDLLADLPPSPWQGKGDHGQGGEGMMGGKPYGRQMAMTDDDRRDGLALDAYAARFGPFLPMLPPGLLLDLTLQGDVIQSATLVRPPFAQADEEANPQPLRLIARLLRVLGLAAQADRLLRAARRREAGEPVRSGGLEGALRRSGVFLALPPGLGSIAGSDVRDRLLGWCAAAGRPDGAARLDLAEAEGSTGLVDLLPGLEWCEAMLVVNSFAPATLRRLCPAPEAEGSKGDAGGASSETGEGG